MDVSEPTLHQIQASPPSPVAPSNFIATVPSLCACACRTTFFRPASLPSRARTLASCGNQAAIAERLRLLQRPSRRRIWRFIEPLHAAAHFRRRPHRRRRRGARCALRRRRRRRAPRRRAFCARARGVLRVGRRLQPLRHRLPLAHVWAAACTPSCAGADRNGRERIPMQRCRRHEGSALEAAWECWCCSVASCPIKRKSHGGAHKSGPCAAEPGLVRGAAYASRPRIRS